MFQVQAQALPVRVHLGPSLLRNRQPLRNRTCHLRNPSKHSQHNKHSTLRQRSNHSKHSQRSNPSTYSQDSTPSQDSNL